MDPAIDLTLRTGLAVMWLAAAAHKLRDPGSFRAVLTGYRLMPETLATGIAPLVPAVELGAAGLMLVWRGGIVSAALLGLYAAALAVNLGRGRRDLDCGCLGWGARRTIGWELVARNGILATAALATLLPSTGRPLIWVDLLTAAAAVTALGACWAAADRLAATAPALTDLREAS